MCSDMHAPIPAPRTFRQQIFSLLRFLFRTMESSEETKRFVEPSEDDVSSMLEKAVPDNTRKATDAWVTVFKAFRCSERKLDFDMSTCSAEELNKVLCQFYPSLWTKKGELYKKSSYFAACAALHR